MSGLFGWLIDGGPDGRAGGGYICIKGPGKGRPLGEGGRYVTGKAALQRGLKLGTKSGLFAKGNTGHCAVLSSSSAACEPSIARSLQQAQVAAAAVRGREACRAFRQGGA